MPGTEWVEKLTVLKLKDELKLRGQPVVGKKAELVARLQEYISQHEVRWVWAAPSRAAPIKGYCLWSRSSAQWQCSAGPPWLIQ